MIIMATRTVSNSMILVGPSPACFHSRAPPLKVMTLVHELNQPAVLDLGSGLTKAGYAGTPDPSLVVGTVVGHPKLPRVLPTSTSAPDVPASHPQTRDDYTTAPPVKSSSEYIVGEALNPLSGIVRLSYPMNRATVVDWPAAEELWRHIIDTLSVAHGEHPFLVTEGPLNPRNNRERIAEFFFESCHVPSLYVSVPAILALYASGRTTGLVLDVGDTVSTAIPVVEGHCDLHAIRRIDLGGRDVNERLTTLLRKSGTSLFTSSSERQAVRRLKERFCYIAVDPREEERRFISEDAEEGSLTASFELPDGNTVHIGPERFRAPEILFRPDIVAREFGGVHECIASSIDSVDMELRRRLYGSVLLAGGATKFRGFGQRLLTEVRSTAPRDSKVRVHAPPDRLFSAFTGGSILASLSTTFRSMAVSRGEYFENGPSVIHRKTL